MKFKLLLFIIGSVWFNTAFCQDCSQLGQNPSSAFPVCGTSTFGQESVPLCGGRPIPTPCRDNAAYGDLNPFWYKFTCFKSGSLAFVITPNDLSDDYDWQLFDVTGRQPNDIYTDASLFVTCNWSSRPGNTGASLAGIGNVNCAGPTYPNFSAMPTLLQGHNYLLLVSHFTLTQSGYKLSFGGGTAVITDTTVAHFQKIEIGCGNQTIGIKLNKKMQCKSLDADGSDFAIDNNYKISGAVGIGCNVSFDMDSIQLTLQTPLSPGNYTLSVKKGTDQNSLLDACDQPMDSNNNISFTIPSVEPPKMDSIFFPKCPPQIITVRFDKKISCTSADPNGNDFKITGPSIVNISSVTSSCDNSGGGYTLDLHLSAPILVLGMYQLHLLPRSDGNTIVSFCGDKTKEGTLDFEVPETVSADFTYTSVINCNFDSITFNNNGGASINNWKWYSNNTLFGTTATVSKKFPVGPTYDIKLLVSNNGCNDSHDTIISLPKIKAAFTAPDAACPKDTVSIVNTSTGNITSYLWNFGNGNSSTDKDPPSQVYPESLLQRNYNISLKITSPGCIDTLSRKITVFSSCYIDLPNSFTPNGDGLNDFFYPLNAFKSTNLTFQVFNRWGNKIFESRDYNSKWDGTFNGVPQPAGIYIWTLNYTNKDTHKTFQKKGTVMLIR